MLPSLIKPTWPRIPAGSVRNAAVISVVASFIGSASIAQPTPTQEDLRALIYYVQNQNEASIAAELKRLQTKFPNWAPPEDLTTLQVQSGPDVASIYRMIEARNISGAKEAIAATQAGNTGWTPPDDLLRALQEAEVQIDFDAALQRRDIQSLAALAQSNPQFVSCERINNPWRISEAYAEVGDRESAIAILRDLVSRCSDMRLVVASIEKTRAIATDEALISTIDVARSRFPNDVRAFDALQARLTGRPVGGAATPAVSQAEARTPAEPSKSEDAPSVPPLTAITEVASVPTSASTPALTRLPARGDGRIGRARSAKNGGDFVGCAAASARPKSLDIAYERAWCVYNLDRALEALALFSAVASKSGLPADVRRDARFGMALSYLKKGMSEEASRLALSTEFLPEQRKDVESAILDQRGVQAYAAQQYVRAIAFFDAYEELNGTLRRDLAIMRAYSFLRSGNRDKANKLFAQIDNQLSTEESRRGLQASQ